MNDLDHVLTDLPLEVDYMGSDYAEFLAGREEKKKSCLQDQS